MIPVRPEELSALLDGELDPARAAEVQTQIQDDPALRQEFEALSNSDAAWRAAAGSATFTPQVTLPVRAEAHSSAGGESVREGGGWLPALGVATGGVILVRSVLKLTGSDAWAFGLPMLSLLLLIAMVIALARTEHHDAAPISSGTGSRPA